ncbi:tail tube protein [Sinorhizobium phage phiM7]|uniref:Tail tube protein n=3 Tax=Emdodecavirus TaxID=1980937 RepID=S5M6M4_9CAUD|nr:tail tube protein [Sinorhizobium phage phiM12]YP_009212310.1 tail tube protein [Sinorhizobium phage phiN3]YP_009601179.1 tail tube protein [Sinorhizobium phage phiM7]AKF12962.1 tail tube protein [Sinorhizobium phage phiM19]AGR47706.1 tail tube protein [Sinorhizobium phage phiM12]AKF12602.1 tail tube protein [Sinorhizobium phage phiM7]AKF13335.1 tail tube protein [Sinorhizobium phage phiN3]
MPFNVNDFRANLTYGGARNNKFEVQVTNPWINTADSKYPFLVKAASLPALTAGTIEIPYMGRKIKLPGDPTYEEWVVTIFNDNDFAIRDSLIGWYKAIHPTVSNTNTFGGTSPALYKSQALVRQLDLLDNVVKTVTFDGIFPSAVSSIELGSEMNDQIEEFTVTFQYDWWE